jgi:glycosyltransferase involved in cell wall biosynthesis
MSSPDEAVTVIIPTLGRAERADDLDLAIRSVLDQREVDVRVVVVLNGGHRCPTVERRLLADSEIRVLSLPGGDLPAALRAGRANVDTGFFTALDDDDLLLPGALRRRLLELESHPDCDVVVTNGYLRAGWRDIPLVGPGRDINGNPLEAFLAGNWLLPGSWLCRSSAVSSDLFDGMPRFLECTYLALRFATGMRMRWIDEPTMVYRLDSPLAESRSRAYMEGQAEALRRLLSLDLPPFVRRELRRRISGACHSASERARSEGAVRDAWEWHLRSVLAPGGWRYLPYSRHLLWLAARPSK